MDIGLIFYRKNDFKNAVIPLKQFTDSYKEKDDRRAEALSLVYLSSSDTAISVSSCSNSLVIYLNVSLSKLLTSAFKFLSPKICNIRKCYA